MASLRKLCTLSDIAAIRTVFPRHTAKVLAVKMGVPVNTAKEWLYHHFSAARRIELARTLLAEMDRQDAEERAPVRQHLQSIVGLNEVGSAGAGLPVQPSRVTGAGATPAELGRDGVAAPDLHRGAR